MDFADICTLRTLRGAARVFPIPFLRSIIHGTTLIKAYSKRMNTWIRLIVSMTLGYISMDRPHGKVHPNRL